MHQTEFKLCRECGNKCSTTFTFCPTCGASLDTSINSKASADASQPAHTELLLGEPVYAAGIAGFALPQMYKSAK